MRDALVDFKSFQDHASIGDLTFENYLAAREVGNEELADELLEVQEARLAELEAHFVELYGEDALPPRPEDD